jgi:hypothetical protein
MGEQRYTSTIIERKLDGDEWSASRSGSFTLGKRPRDPLDMRLGSPRAGLGTMQKRTTSFLRQESNANRPVAMRTELWWRRKTLSLVGCGLTLSHVPGG